MLLNEQTTINWAKAKSSRDNVASLVYKTKAGYIIANEGQTVDRDAIKLYTIKPNGEITKH